MSNNPFRQSHASPNVRYDAGENSGRSLVPPQNPFGNAAAYDHSDQYLSPMSADPGHYRDQSPNPFSPTASAFSSRRSSWASERSADSRGFQNPFADTSTSRAPSRAGSDDDINTQTVAEKYAILPSAGLLLYPEDVEKDDYLHNPDPKGEPRDCNVFTKRGIVNVGGLAFIILGILTLFIVYPAITFVQKLIKPVDPCKSNPNCIFGVEKVPLLKNVRTGLIDPDTPKSALTKTDFHGKTWKLAFSDEFSKPGRTFFSGDDPYFTAVDIWYGATQDIEYYDPDAVITKNGVLELRFDAFQNHNLNYRSGMLQSWNQVCMTQGRLEASISLPGRGDTVGFWPGFWTLGNLGRAGHVATTDGMWPYSYDDVCDAGITPNQSSSDGINYLPGMRLPACTCTGEDHPTPGKSRSAPELDVIEASNGPYDASRQIVGDVSQSFQVAPFDIWYQPNYDFVELYDPRITRMNGYKGGPYQQAISGLSYLNNDWYEGKQYQVYAFEYTPGDDGDISWWIGDTATWRIHQNALGPNGNVGKRVIPREPMSMVVNFGMSPSFSSINWAGMSATLPATMRIDYIRIYQDDDGQMTCDPPGYETTDYIRSHQKFYDNPNITKWQAGGASWPKNTLMNNCK